MATRRRKRRSIRQLVSTELELMPMLNVFIAIIPLLLLSAAFVPVAVIKTTLPSTNAVAASTDEAPLDLDIFIRKDAYVVQVNGAVARSIARAADEAGATEARRQLAETLKEIAAAHPGHREVRIVSEATTRYEEIVRVMDAARAAGLPDAALSEAATEVS